LSALNVSGQTQRGAVSPSTSGAGLLAVAFPSTKPADATVTEVKDGKDDEKHLCPSCGAKFVHADIRALNPPPEEEARLRLELAAAAAAKPSKVKKRKAGADAPAPAEEPPAPKKPKAEVAGASRALAAGLAMEDARRKAGMSDAVKSLYAKDAGRAQTWATMGTFTRVRALLCYVRGVCADGGCSMREAGWLEDLGGYVCIMECETLATNARSEQSWAGFVFASRLELTAHKARHRLPPFPLGRLFAGAFLSCLEAPSSVSRGHHFPCSSHGWHGDRLLALGADLDDDCSPVDVSAGRRAEAILATWTSTCEPLEGRAAALSPQSASTYTSYLQANSRRASRLGTSQRLVSGRASPDLTCVQARPYLEDALFKLPTPRYLTRAQSAQARRCLGKRSL
jgi:hypothetical protein